MTHPPRCASLLVTSAALCLAASTGLATAQQYSQAEAEACTPDAIKFCSDTIPDVGRTAACVQRNFNNLTPACQSAFVAATQPAAAPAMAPAAPEPAPAPAPAMEVVAAPPPPPAPAPAAPAPVAAPAFPDLTGANLFAPEAPAPRVRYARHHHRVHESLDARRARHALRHACSTGYISADLCRFTAQLITLAR